MILGKAGRLLQGGGQGVWSAPVWSSIGSNLPSWTWRDMAFSNGWYVAVNSNGTAAGDRIQRSQDGLTWVKATTIPTTALWKTVCHGGGRLVISCNSLLINPNTLYSDDDGDTWSFCTPGPAGSYISVNDMAYGNGVFVAVGNSGACMRSTDGGITFNTVSTGNTRTWSSIAYGAGRFVAVCSSLTGTDFLMYSDDDGATWTLVDAADYPTALSSIRSIAYGNGRFVAVSSGGSTLAMFSSDGEHWTAAGGVLSSCYVVKYRDGVFHALVGSSSQRNYYSTDGDVWTEGGELVDEGAVLGNWQILENGDAGLVALNMSAGGLSAVAYAVTVAVASTLNLLLSSVIGAAAGSDKELFSSIDHSGSGAYVRNVNCWAHALRGDLTCVPVGANNGTGWYDTTTAALITPRHLCGCGHNLQLVVGSTVRFVTEDNNVVERTVIGTDVREIYNAATDWKHVDVGIATLDSSVPGTITPAKILPADYLTHLAGVETGTEHYTIDPTGIIIVDKDKRASITDLAEVWDEYEPTLDREGRLISSTPEDEERLALFESHVSGDSGSPAFLFTTGGLILLFPTGTSPWQGTNILRISDAHSISLASMIANADANGGVSTGLYPETGSMP